MTGYAFAMSPCLLCKRVFSYNPLRVPSSSALTGSREPICRICMERINSKREEMGMEPFSILPDAYEPIAEEEL